MEDVWFPLQFYWKEFWCWIIVYWHRQPYLEFFKWKDFFGFSNYSKVSKFSDETNKKVIGKMKDEFDGVIVDEFIGLK